MSITQTALTDAIMEKYIRPIRRPRTQRAGLEFEMPIVNRKGAAVDFAVVHALTADFISAFGFSDEHRDDDGYIYCAADPVSGDTISYDCSYNTLELSFGKARDLLEVKARFETYVRFLNRELGKSGYTLTGMGIHPNANINRNQPIQNERYRMLYHYLHSYPQHADEVAMRFHQRPPFGSQQVSGSRRQSQEDSRDCRMSFRNRQRSPSRQGLLF